LVVAAQKPADDVPQCLKVCLHATRREWSHGRARSLGRESGSLIIPQAI